MIRIEEMNYNQIIPLLLETPKTTPTNAWAIVEKYIEGNIFSNTNIHPKAALIGSDNGTYFLGGEPYKSFIDEFSTFYMEKKEERFTIFSPNKLWDEVIESVMIANTKKMERKIFFLNAKKFVQEVQSIREPFDIEIHSITKDSIIKSNNFNEAYYKENWGSTEQYLKYGIGFYATNSREEIISECTSIFRNNNKANIDIYTTDKARGKGLAFHLCKAFIDNCLQNGITPVWDCDSLNESSVNLAKKLGFEQLGVYHLYYKNF